MITLPPSTRELLHRAREMQEQVVFTNGCYDLLHVGHKRLLEQARGYGQILIVGLNSDESVRRLKGPSRPVFYQEARAEMLKAFRYVDDVVVFDTLRCDDLIRAIRPDVYVKGGDYDISTLDPQELKALTAVGSLIFLPPLIDGLSTTSIIEKLK